jgi:hypothetical protein
MGTFLTQTRKKWGKRLRKSCVWWCSRDPRRNHAQYNREGNTTIPASTADILGEDMPHIITIITPE